MVGGRPGVKVIGTEDQVVSPGAGVAGRQKAIAPLRYRAPLRWRDLPVSDSKEMGDEGLEPDSINLEFAKDLRQSLTSDGAETGAKMLGIGTEASTNPIDPDLIRIGVAWERLSSATRAAMLSLIESDLTRGT